MLAKAELSLSEAVCSLWSADCWGSKLYANIKYLINLNQLFFDIHTCNHPKEPAQTQFFSMTFTAQKKCKICFVSLIIDFCVTEFTFCFKKFILKLHNFFYQGKQDNYLLLVCFGRAARTRLLGSLTCLSDAALPPTHIAVSLLFLLASLETRSLHNCLPEIMVYMSRHPQKNPVWG